MAKPLVVLGLVGSVLDGAGDARKARSEHRGQRWRPSVDVARQPSLSIARFELLHQPEHLAFADVVKADIETVSPATTVRLQALSMRDPWDFESVYAALYDFAAAYPFHVDDEDYLLHITTGTHVFQICLFLLAEARRIPAKLLQAAPPRDKKLAGTRNGTTTVIDLDLSRYEAIRRRFTAQHHAGSAFLKAGIPTKNATYNALIDELETVASSSTAPVLLTGPTGTGKTRLARRLYELKREREQVRGPFVEVNCATLRGDAAMSTLFGHKKGAFTGAVVDREGLLLRAKHGVLFLDEIGELGLDEQAMLLRAIEEKRFLPLGADVEVSSSFQLVCGTHRDLSAHVRAGRFREDLLARLDVWRFALPALRERPEDIGPNVDVELERLAHARGQRVHFAAGARARFLAFATTAPWPGNFRELAACLERLVTLCQGAVIDDDDVERELARLRRAWQAPSPGAPVASDVAGIDGAGIDVAGGDVVGVDVAGVDVVGGDVVGGDVVGGGAAFDGLDEFDRVQLQHVVAVCRQSRSLAEAGRRLFAASRQQKTSSNDSDRLRKYLASHGLRFDRLRRAAR
jgi:transcriptional regulatory protein RtcR